MGQIMFYRRGGAGTVVSVRISGSEDNLPRLQSGQAYEMEIVFMPAADHPSMPLGLDLQLDGLAQQVLGLDIQGKVVAGQVATLRFDWVPADVYAGMRVECLVDSGTDPPEIAIGFPAEII